MAMHLDRDVNSASQMAIHLEMRSMSSCNREPPDQYEDGLQPPALCYGLVGPIALRRGLADAPPRTARSSAVEERESSARRQIDRAISTMHKIVQSKEAKVAASSAPAPAPWPLHRLAPSRCSPAARWRGGRAAGC